MRLHTYVRIHIPRVFEHAHIQGVPSLITDYGSPNLQPNRKDQSFQLKDLLVANSVEEISNITKMQRTISMKHAFFSTKNDINVTFHLFDSHSRLRC